MKLVASSLAITLAALTFLPAVSADGVPPPSPAWIDATYDETGQAVWLTWAEVESASSYRVYRNADLIATIQAPGYLDQDVALEAASYRVTAMANEVESPPATATVAQAAVGNVGLMLAPSSSPYVAGYLVGMKWCVPVGIGGEFPFFSINSGCLEDLHP